MVESPRNSKEIRGTPERLGESGGFLGVRRAADQHEAAVSIAAFDIALFVDL